MGFCVAAPTPTPSPKKPKPDELLKPKSLTRILEDYDVITNSEWLENSDFSFVNATLIRVPLKYARPKVMDFSVYPKMTSALKKLEYNPKTQIIEVIGEAGGLRMHSWVQVDQQYWDEIAYEVVQGDMLGFKIRVYLWDTNGKTLVAAKGILPGGKKRFSSVIVLLMKPVSEIVLGVATRNFRSYIEEEYKKQKTQTQ